MNKREYLQKESRYGQIEEFILNYETFFTLFESLANFGPQTAEMIRM